MAERMAGLRFRGIAEQAADIRITFNIRHPCEIEVTPISLRLTRKGALQIFVTLCVRKFLLQLVVITNKKNY
jgi:hypothetical protein